jgi:hypothetical protein
MTNASQLTPPPPSPPQLSDYLATLKLHVDMANSEKQAIWARQASMVVGNSLLINAIEFEKGSWTGSILSIAGLLLCVLWGIITSDGWKWSYKPILDAKKLPIPPELNPFSSFPHKGKGDRHSDVIFKCTMAMIGLFGLIYLVLFLRKFY